MFPVPWKLVGGAHSMYSGKGLPLSIAATSSRMLSLFPSQVAGLEVT